MLLESGLIHLWMAKMRRKRNMWIKIMYKDNSIEGLFDVNELIHLWRARNEEKKEGGEK